ncbi:hypothetical protein V8F33_007069 [Rhypophila sp. PSN 637]
MSVFSFLGGFHLHLISFSGFVACRVTVAALHFCRVVHSAHHIQVSRSGWNKRPANHPTVLPFMNGSKERSRWPILV